MICPPIMEIDSTLFVTTQVGSAPLPRKLGANHGETASRPRKHHNNFKQSKDIREDRGIRQIKASPKAQSARGGR